MQRVAFLSVLVLSLGCTGGSSGAGDVELRFAPLVVAAGANPIAAQAQDTVSGNVDLNATGWLALGSIPGILIGSQLTVRVPERVIRASLGTVLFVSGAKLVGAF